MNKKELANAIAEKMGVTAKIATTFIDTFRDVVTDEVAKGGTVQLVNFVTVKPQYRNARQGRDPRNPSKVIEIPATFVPKFVAGKAFKEKVTKNLKK